MPPKCSLRRYCGQHWGQEVGVQDFRVLGTHVRVAQLGNLVNLRKEFYGLQYQDGADMRWHLNSLKTLAERISNVSEAPMQENDKVSRLLASLPDTWTEFNDLYFMKKSRIQ